MLEFLKFPKIISSTEYDFNKDNYLEYSVISKNTNNIVLFNSDEYKEANFWFINEFADRIKVEFDNAVFVIVERKNDNIEFIIGSSYDASTMQVSFLKILFTMKEFERHKTIIRKKIELLKMFFNDKGELLVFSVDSESKEIAHLLLDSFKIVDCDFEAVLKKTKFHQSIQKRLLPFFIVSIFFTIFYFLSNYIIDTSFEKVYAENVRIEKELNAQLKLQEKKKSQLNKEMQNSNRLQSSILNLHNKIYKD